MSNLDFINPTVGHKPSNDDFRPNRVSSQNPAGIDTRRFRVKRESLAATSAIYIINPTYPRWHRKIQLGPVLRHVQFHMRLLLVLLPFIWLCAVAPAQDVVIRDAKIYTSPEAPSRTHVTVLIHGGKIAALGSNVRIPAVITALQCNGCVVFAGFWNSHVHFTGAQWDDAAILSPLARKRSTIFEPMPPAPPVTTTMRSFFIPRAPLGPMSKKRQRTIATVYS
jgi:hypothetical protein